MKMSDLIAALEENYVVLSRGASGTLDLTPVFPEREIPPALVAECRRYKPKLLDHLKWVEAADHALLLSTHRIAEHYPVGCDALDTDATWDAFEVELRDAYQRQDRAVLTDVILRREAHALDVFDRFRTEAP